MLLSIIDDKKKLLALLAVLYIFSYLAQLHVVYPIEQMLDFEITKHASIVYLPAGFVFLSFYLLRFWFIPLIVTIRTVITIYVYQVTAWDALMISIFVALCYPMWSYILRNANWDVFGDRDPNNLTITGVMVFQFVTSFSIGLMSASYFSITQSIAPEESLQFIVHLTIGDTLGAGVVVYLFYLSMKFATKKNHSTN